jgi:hypothetical protein
MPSLAAHVGVPLLPPHCGHMALPLAPPVLEAPAHVVLVVVAPPVHVVLAPAVHALPQRVEHVAHVLPLTPAAHVMLEEPLEEPPHLALGVLLELAEQLALAHVVPVPLELSEPLTLAHVVHVLMELLAPLSPPGPEPLADQPVALHSSP